MKKYYDMLLGVNAPRTAAFVASAYGIFITIFTVAIRDSFASLGNVPLDYKILVTTAYLFSVILGSASLFLWSYKEKDLPIYFYLIIVVFVIIVKIKYGLHPKFVSDLPTIVNVYLSIQGAAILLIALWASWLLGLHLKKFRGW